jgi:hypothetical protein
MGSRNEPFALRIASGSFVADEPMTLVNAATTTRRPRSKGLDPFRFAFHQEQVWITTKRGWNDFQSFTFSELDR